MNSTNEVCEVSGAYTSYAPCGHAQERWFKQGDVFSACRICNHTLAWSLLRETDRWGDYHYADETPDSEFRGMTVNERLFSASLMDEFDNAVQVRDRAKIISLLQQTGIALPFAERVAESVLARASR